jgi:hypothetical protein
VEIVCWKHLKNENEKKKLFKDPADVVVYVTLRLFISILLSIALGEMILLLVLV